MSSEDLNQQGLSVSLVKCLSCKRFKCKPWEKHLDCKRLVLGLEKHICKGLVWVSKHLYQSWENKIGVVQSPNLEIN